MATLNLDRNWLGSKNSYRVFMIDPPWNKKKAGYRKVRPAQTRNFSYKTLSTDEIFCFIRDFIVPMADQVHCVFMWTIESYLIECEEQMRLLGYKMHCRLIWDKGNGIAPAFTIRFSHEYLIWYYKPKLMPIDPKVRGRFSSVMRERARQHSRKPDIAYQLLDALYPDTIKLDVYSREKRSGWEQYGDQPDYFKKISDETE